MSKLTFDHELALHTAGRLDTLADQLEGRLRTTSTSLHPAAGAHDAVSLHTARTLGQVGASFHESYLTGPHELRKIAANLRSHAKSFTAADDQGVDTFRSLT
ncbi:MAG: PE domain-containing protein [Mycobacterium sp.]|nr:PE domain-containing protein [Mycobacterium sp.]